MKRFIAFCLVFMMNVALQAIESAPEADRDPANAADVTAGEASPDPVGPVALSAWTQDGRHIGGRCSSGRSI